MRATSGIPNSDSTDLIVSSVMFSLQSDVMILLDERCCKSTLFEPHCSLMSWSCPCLRC